MPYTLEVSPEFEEVYKRLTSRNNAFKRTLDNKINQIVKTLESNPDHYKPLKGPLAGVRRVHVESSFVLLFEINKTAKTARLLKIEHHDKAYKN